MYGYQAVNVEAQLRTPTSLLRWLHRFIALRKEHPVFGLGTYEPLTPDEPAHLRPRAPLRGRRRAVRAQPRRCAQAVELDLSEFDGAVPEELLGGAAFPTASASPYLLTLGARGFYWFQLRRPDA